MLTEITLPIQLAVGLVFLRSTVGKLIDPRGFAEGFRQYGLHGAGAYLLATVIIFSEAAAAAAYLVGWNLRWIAPLAVCLLMSFLIVTVVALQRNMDVNCMCFGVSKHERISTRTVWRIVVMLSAAGFVALSRWRAVDWPVTHELPGDRAALVLGAAVLLLAVVMWGYGTPALKALFIPCKACGKRGGSTFDPSIRSVSSRTEGI